MVLFDVNSPEDIYSEVEALNLNGTPPSWYLSKDFLSYTNKAFVTRRILVQIDALFELITLFSGRKLLYNYLSSACRRAVE